MALSVGVRVKHVVLVENLKILCPYPDGTEVVHRKNDRGEYTPHDAATSIEIPRQEG